jgi:hypothetical protein
MEDSHRANSVFTESYHSREGKSCGLDVEPEVAFRGGRKTERKHEKTIKFSRTSGIRAAGIFTIIGQSSHL